MSLGLKALAFALGIGYIILDARVLGKGLTMTRAQRDRVERHVILEGRQEVDPLTKRRPNTYVTYAGLGMLAALLVCAWTLFFLGFAT